MTLALIELSMYNHCLYSESHGNVEYSPCNYVGV